MKKKAEKEFGERVPASRKKWRKHAWQSLHAKRIEPTRFDKSRPLSERRPIRRKRFPLAGMKVGCALLL
jgi:hypothetical protein